MANNEMDSLSRGTTERKPPATAMEAFDVRKLDKVPKAQLQSLQLLHENFARNLASSLSAYLRSYVALDVVGLEQITYAEFGESISAPACLAYLDIQPHGGSAVLEISSALAFRFIELLLGSKQQSAMPVQRKITDIEKKLLHTVVRILLRDLNESWKSVAEVDFAVQSLASEPQLLHVLAPSEAMIAIALDVRLGSASGLMKLAIPSVFVKRLRNNFDQLQRVRRTQATTTDQLHVGRLLQGVKLNLEIQMPGGEIHAKTLLELQAGDVLVLDYPGSAPLKGLLNGKPKWLGEILDLDGKLAFEITKEITR